jgi:hypothetical protein
LDVNNINKKNNTGTVAHAKTLSPQLATQKPDHEFFGRTVRWKNAQLSGKHKKTTIIAFRPIMVG